MEHIPLTLNHPFFPLFFYARVCVFIQSPVYHQDSPTFLTVLDIILQSLLPLIAHEDAFGHLIAAAVPL